MILSVDIGGTNIRLKYNNIYESYIHKATSINNFIEYIKIFIAKVNKNDIDKIIIALPGIVENFKCFNDTNLLFLNNVKLPKMIKNIPVIYGNDGDLNLLGEIKYNKLDSSKNILSLIFGTGVGCGLWMNGHIKNSEIYRMFENYLGGKKFHKSNINQIKIRFINDIAILIDLLNLDCIIINGFIKSYPILNITIEELDISEYHKQKINLIYSTCTNAIILGTELLDNNCF